MSTSNPQSSPDVALPKVADARIAIVGTYWNAQIIENLRSGAIRTLVANGFDTDTQVVNYSVPGAVELTYAAKRLIDSHKFDAVILLGCVIRGGTPHFDYVCQSVTQGMTSLNLLGQIPVIFGVLTVDNEQDAIDRAGGSLGNKGSEAAEAAIHAIHFSRSI